MSSKTMLHAVVVVCLLIGAAPAQAQSDALPSWNDGPAKKAIIDFVTKVTTPGTPDFVPVEDRIATFDNDGTLWVEKPMYTHLEAVLARYKELLTAKPELASKEPYKAVAAKNLDYFGRLYEEKQLDTVVSDIVGVPFEGMSTTEYDAWNHKFLSEWKHPRFKVGYRDLIYQPMVELLRYLKSKDFDLYIATADEAAFLKPISEELYGIPGEKVIGSAVKLSFDGTSKPTRVVRTKETAYIDVADGKPKAITEVIGKRPIFAAGNTNGDLEMLQYTAGQDRKSLSVFIHHTDEKREYKYDKHTDKALPAAKAGGWTIVDMAKDWKIIFPSQKRADAR